MIQLEEEYVMPEEPLPEQALAAAVIARVCADITSPHGMYREEALTWLLESDGLEFFAACLNIDADFLREQITIECGLSDEAPRLGIRREPIPSQHGFYSRERDLVSSQLHRKRHSKLIKGRTRAINKSFVEVSKCKGGSYAQVYPRDTVSPQQACGARSRALHGGVFCRLRD